MKVQVCAGDQLSYVRSFQRADVVGGLVEERQTFCQ